MLESLLASTNNTRFLPDDRRRLLRSDAVIDVEPSDLVRLREYHISLVLDLRTEAEARILPCPLNGYPCFDYFLMPVSACGGTSAEAYLSMLNAEMLEIISTLEKANGNALYFCHEGRDRSGVVSVLLLMRQGVDDAVIIEDYLYSFRNASVERKEAAVKAITEFLKVLHEDVSLERYIRR